MKKKETRTDIFCSALLWLLSLTVFLPLLMIVFTSFKDKKEGATLNLVLPAKWMWENYVQVLKTGNVLRALGNSVFVSAVTLVIVLITASMLGYMIARLNTRGRPWDHCAVFRNADHDAAAEHEDLWRRVGPDLRILRAVSSVFNHDHHQLYPGASKRAG